MCYELASDLVNGVNYDPDYNDEDRDDEDKNEDNDENTKDDEDEDPSDGLLRLRLYELVDDDREI